MSLLLALALLSPAADPTPKAGVLPVGTDGQPLNLDFETGTLKDWTAEGEAFKGQPIKGDAVAARRGDMKSGHQGQFWIGGFEKLTDKPTGTLTSVPFKVTHPWASFLIGGGNHPKETCVELVDVAGKTVFFTAPGHENEEMRRVAVDVSKLSGKEIQVRVVDKHTGHWGHVNFDDFRFHAEKPDVPAPAAVLPEQYKYAGQTPTDAAKNMTVPPGFKVDLIAGEPDLHQPIAFTWDDRGRLWVVEAFTYPKRNPEKGPVIPASRDRKGAAVQEGDRILIFEDTDGDGTFDKKTVFIEGLNLVSGIELGFGGVWVGAAPYLVFIPILPGDKPGEPKILLDGWGYEDTHETLNSFIWGPDGYLYGCHGVFTHSNVGKPGTAAKDRTKINAGIWRYHPTKHTFEVFAHGTSNPWGLDYNANGDFFIEACVIPHLWHIVQGGRYERQAGQHFNPHTYDAQIKTIAKHRHFLGGQWNEADRAKSNDLGGGHAHSGLMVYQGGAWPKEYHGKLFMGNIHGHRINVDEVKPKGSSYEGDRNPDFLLSHDKHFILVAIHAGPDGNVYFCDWSDKQVCHRNEPEIWDRTNGRLFRIAHEDAKPLKPFDLQKLEDEKLVELQTSSNEWMVRHARRILQERAAGLKVTRKKPREIVIDDAVVDYLAGIADFKDDSVFNHEKERLRGLWALHAYGGLKPKQVAKGLADTGEYVRAWTVQLALQEGQASPEFLDKLVGLAKKDPSPVVRLYIASGLQRLPLEQRWEVAKALTRFPEDADDHVLPNLYWNALEPLCAEDPAKGLALAAGGKVPSLLPLAARRVGAIGTPAAADALVSGLAAAKSPEHQLAFLRGLQESVKGKRTADAPKGWAKLYDKTLSESKNAEVKQLAVELGAKYGDLDALSITYDIAANLKAALSARRSALALLLEVNHKDLGCLLVMMAKEAAMRGDAIRAMAQVADPAFPELLLTLYPTLTAAEKRDAIATLASRAAFADELLDAVAAKKIPTADIPAEAIRQLRGFGDKALSAKTAAVWGTVRDTPADRKKLIADYGKALNPGALAKADLGAGRAVYAKVCQQCHTLYGVGGKVGPEITGANRADLGYLLENVFDPSAVIPKEYAATKLDLADGRSVIGIIKEETAATLTVATANETLTIPVKDVDKRTPSDLSMMPDDLTKQLNAAQLRDLFAYLKHPAQVPLLANAENAKEFFNGKDLTGWDGDKDVWSVENGEIVGKTKTGLKKNTFLKAPMEVTDFKLSAKVKLTPNAENSGIQFRSANVEGGEMRGPQADIGKGWWGKLYEESGRGLLVKGDNDKLVKDGEWNEYVVWAVGGSVRIWLNGEIACDYHNDDKLARRGLIAFQVHSGGPMEVRFKDIKLEMIEKK